MNMDSRQEYAKSSTLNQAVTSLIANEMATHVVAPWKQKSHRIFRTEKICSIVLCKNYYTILVYVKEKRTELSSLCHLLK